MAITNRISEVIPQNIIEECVKKLKEVDELLHPYVLEALSKDEDDALAKLGEKSEPFVEKGIAFMDTNPQFIPSWVSAAEAKKDFDVFGVLRPIDILLAQLAGEVSATRKVAGSEALAATNAYCGAVSDADRQGVATAKPIKEELGKRYQANGRRKKKAE